MSIVVNRDMIRVASIGTVPVHEVNRVSIIESVQYCSTAIISSDYAAVRRIDVERVTVVQRIVHVEPQCVAYDKISSRLHIRIGISGCRNLIRVADKV